MIRTKLFDMSVFKHFKSHKLKKLFAFKQDALLLEAGI